MIDPADDQIDAHVDTEIDSYLNLDNPRSFFLFAGAGSGKTRSLVNALQRLCESSERRLRLQRRSIAVITYTNAACNEIQQRLDFNPTVHVSTIHSFVWELIKTLQLDIREWLRANLRLEIAVLEEAQQRGRASKASRERARKIQAKGERLARLDTVKKFTYSPTGDNRGRDALNHSEVIKIGADFLRDRAVMRSILVNQFPVLMIDESQDTIRGLMEAFLYVQVAHKDRFVLGLFGDMMQRIFGEGKPDLGRNLPPDWATPVKKMNYRSPERIVALINRIRSDVDAQSQQARKDKPGGTVQLFILPSTTGDKPEAERRIRMRMAELTQDSQWKDAEKVKTLMLEHHMAADRMGFADLFMPLYIADEGSFRTALLEGTLSGMKFFTDLILPLRLAYADNDDFAIAALVRKLSPLFSELKASKGEDQAVHIRSARKAVDDLMLLWSHGEPTLRDILVKVQDSRLFEIPESLQLVSLGEPSGASPGASADADDGRDPLITAWDATLGARFSQVGAYAQYIHGDAPFGTHQGIKGLEFPRVLVVMDDSGARGRGFFSYEKLFGAAGKSEADLQREGNQEETVIDRTRRLFYVTCSRAEESLALVAYSEKPEQVRGHVLSRRWFEPKEVDIVT
jgi:DNA helicase II / ATP-dependent DNA helicase PcrA